ncbi:MULTISPECIES: hypothetical protein [unclassified Rathayibacter]|nr:MULTISPECIES: hypothetical protein [unclassified Rathayibacter]
MLVPETTAEADSVVELALKAESPPFAGTVMSGRVMSPFESVVPE